MADAKLQSWNELKNDIEVIFGEKTRDYKKNVYYAFQKIINEIEQQSQNYILNPEDFQNYVNNNADILDGFYYWMPYLSGERAKLLILKLYDKNFNEITTEKNTEEEVNNAFMVISVNKETLNKFLVNNNK